MTVISPEVEAETIAQQVNRITDTYSRPDLHISGDDSESPWMVYVEGIYIRYTMFDVRQGQWGLILKTDGPAELGRHKHRSPVNGITLAGSWGYREYDWVARAGSYIHESPGAIHTLYCDDPAGMEAYFMMTGTVEYFDEADNIIETQDIFYAINLYLKHCEANGLPVNERLFR